MGECKRFFLEVTHPPVERNHIGKCLWSPVGSTWRIMEELEPGDCVLHYISSRAKGWGKVFIGVSRVKRKAEIISRKELIERLKKLNVWDPSYEEFAREWLDRYSDFYFVELTDFIEFSNRVSLDYLKRKGVEFNPPQIYMSKIDRETAERILGLAVSQLDALQAILWKVPPSTNCYRGFDEQLFENILSGKGGIPSYLKEGMVAWEWWNFYEEFNDRYYYVYLPTGKGKPTKPYMRLIFMLAEEPSQGSQQGSYLVVGVLGCAKILDREIKYGRVLWDSIDEKYKRKIPDNIREKILNDAYFYIVAPKDYSTPLPVPMRINTRNLFNKNMPISGFFAYISFNQAMKLLDMIIAHLKEHSSKTEKDKCVSIEEALRRINNIKKVLEEYREKNILECPEINDSEIKIHSIDDECSKILPKFKDKIMETLRQYGQVILYGPPGTGKTFIAQCIARYGGFKEWEMIVFHQSYSYEDFVEGFRPQASSNNTLQYVIEDGVFKQLSIKALYDLIYNDKNKPANNVESYSDMKQKVLEHLNNKGKHIVKDNENVPKYLLIIDEINRGNISGIFGELITLLEKDKRIGEKNSTIVKLPYSKEPFGIPSNLYIIGTMNTADRSIAFLDWALRRRFGFIEVYVQPELLEGYKVKLDNIEIPLGKLLEELNDRLRKHNLSRDQLIGHTYLMNIENPEQLYVRMYTQIIPLIMEYLYDNEEALREVLDGFIDKNTLEIADPCKNRVDENCLKEFMEKLKEFIGERTV